MEKNSTKNRIASALITLLEQESFDSISVKKIVESAKINKNTFYYYFGSIYELIEYIFDLELCNKISLCTDQGSSFYQEYLRSASILFEHRTAIMNLYHSKCQSLLHDFIKNISRMLIHTFVTRKGKTFELDSTGINHITDYYANNLIEVTMQWIAENMPPYREQRIRMMARFFDASLVPIIQDYVSHSSEYIEF